MREQEIADRYFAAMRAQDIAAVLAVFDAAALLVWPDGRRIEGLAAIRDIYTRLFQQPSNNPVPGAPMIGPEIFATEVASFFDSGETRRTINVFRLTPDGLIARMDSYRQG